MEKYPRLNVIQLSEVLKVKWCHYSFLIVHKCTKMSLFLHYFPYSLFLLSILSLAVLVNWQLSGVLVKFLYHYLFLFLMSSGICHVRLHENGRNTSLNGLKIYPKCIIVYFLLHFYFPFTVFFFFLPELWIHPYGIFLSRQPIFLYYCLIYKFCGFCFLICLHFWNLIFWEIPFFNS